MKIVEKLKEAAKNGERVKIIYHGGSQPGAQREIAPIKVTETEIRARCYKSNSVKIFKIKKIELAFDGMSTPAYNPDYKKLVDSRTILEAMSVYMEELKQLGWHIDLDQEFISVHRYFKNGKIRKGADAGIIFRGESSAIASVEEQDLINEGIFTISRGNSQRPWYVYGPDLSSARTFTHLDKAIRLFLEQVRKHAPNKE